MNFYFCNEYTESSEPYSLKKYNLYSFGIFVMCEKCNNIKGLCNTF